MIEGVTSTPTGADIFAGHGPDAEQLAEIYDLEHDEVTQDLGFYRQMVRRVGKSVLDLGCGSGRLFRAFFEGGATSVVGVDGSPALIARADRRIAEDRLLSEGQRAGRLRVVLGDVRRPPPSGRHRFIVFVGVLPHLGGPEDALRALSSARERLDAGGRLVIDDIGPAGLPWRDLPFTLDWEKELRGRKVTRRSQLTRHESPEGLWVDYATLTDSVRPDGTIARLPASFRLWYPSLAVLERLLDAAGLAVELTYGSHDLDPIDETSERRIVVARKHG
jgi:SAM-dependent methyltransferase